MAHRIILTAFQPDEQTAADLVDLLADLCEREGALVANLEFDGPIPDDDFQRIADEVGG